MDILNTLLDALGYTLFTFGGARFTPGSALGMLAALIALLWFSLWLRAWMLHRMGRYGNVSPSTLEVMASLTRYAVLAIGLMLILEQAAVKLSSFTLLAGALGVGVGFGLQNICSNFVSGLIVVLDELSRLKQALAPNP